MGAPFSGSYITYSGELSMRKSRSFRTLWSIPRRVTLCLILLIGPAWLSGNLPALAQGGPGDLWQTFTVDDGILSNNILAVFPAGDGSIWFGTDAGASRYDGSWQSWTTEVGLPQGPVRAITQTTDGAVWFATESGGLARREANGECCRIWTTADGLPSNDVRALLSDGENSLWVGTAAGLVYLDNGRVVGVEGVAESLVWTIVRGSPDTLWVSAQGEGVWERDGAGIWRLLNGNEMVRGDVYALWPDREGRLWAGTQNGLVYYENGHWQRQPLLADDTGLRVFSILTDNEDGFWVGADQGCFYAPVGRLPDGEFTRFQARDNRLVNDHVRAMASDDGGVLWMGTIAGVSRYVGNIWYEIADPALRDQRVNTVLTDNAGRTWAGTEQNGLAMWNGTYWQHFTEQNGLPDNRVVTLFEDDQGRVWIGTGSSVGFWAENGGTWQFFSASSLAGVPVYSIAQDTNGSLWFATERGVSRWDEATGFTAVPELAGKRVNAIHRSRDGALWFGTDTAGLWRLSGGEWRTMDAPTGEPFNLIVANGITESPDGTLWVGMYDDGLWRYRDKVWWQADAFLASPLVLSVRYAGGSLWVGTRVGLDRYDDQTWQSYVGDVLPSSEVLSVAPGVGSVVWIGTKAGLVRYRPEKAAPWVRVETVNLIEPIDGVVKLVGDKLRALRLVGGDLATRPEHLIFLTQLDGADTMSQVHSSGQISYRDLQLSPGAHGLRVWARDAAFNYSSPVEIKLVAPRMVRLPGGGAVVAETFYIGLFLGVLALGGVTAAGRISWRARTRERRHEAEMATRQREALARHFNPYISGEPVRREEMFFGREALLRKILNALHQNSIMIHGERRMGKTTLLFQLAEALRQADDPEWVFIPVSVDLEGTAPEHFFHLLMEATWGVLRGYLTGAPLTLRFDTIPSAAYTDRDFTADLRVLLDALKDVVALRQVRVILLMDEMDVISTYDAIIQQQLRRIFMSSLAQNLGAVVAGIQISKAWDRVESPWFNLFNEIPLDPFTDEQARELLTEPVRGVYEWDLDAIEFVLAHTAGRPYRLQQYALEAVNHMLTSERLRITMADVQAADAVIERAQTE